MYEALRAFNPSPYMAFIHSPEFAVVSGSPELISEEKRYTSYLLDRLRGQDHVVKVMRRISFSK